MFWKKEKEQMGCMAGKAEMMSKSLLCAAGVAAVAAITLKCLKKHHTSLMIGQLVAPMMLMSMHPKMGGMAKMAKMAHHKHHKGHHHKHECW